MILSRFRPVPKARTIDGLYGAIVAQARDAAFYRDHGVPDTVNGRLEMIILHAVLVVRRLGSEPEETRRLGQELFDLFCRDMDHNLREMGIGDLTVPKQMRRIGEAFYGRLRAYEAALEDADPAALAKAIDRNVYAGTSAAGGQASAGLAVYVRAVAENLQTQSGEDLRGGKLQFPPVPSAQA